MENGDQRLPIELLKKWSQKKLGLFFHFGVSTFDGEEMSKGTLDLSEFSPEKLDIRQWISAAKAAGAKYAILTAKHVSGFCLWPSHFTEYNCMNSPIKKDIVGEFCSLCRQADIEPCLYYCSWDNHHLFGSMTPSMTSWNNAFVTQQYFEFEKNQILELLNLYSPLMEIWIDIPHVLGRSYRTILYNTIAKEAPSTVIIFNHGISMLDGSTFNVAKAWPTDIITIERNLPKSENGYEPWREFEHKHYYMPGEVVDTLTNYWFYDPNEKARNINEILGMYLVATNRGCNFVLNVAPNKDGLISTAQISLLEQLRKKIELCE